MDVPPVPCSQKRANVHCASCTAACRRAAWHQRRAGHTQTAKLLRADPLPLEGLPPALAQKVAALPASCDVLLRCPAPRDSLARRSGLLRRVSPSDIADLAGSFAFVVDVGVLCQAGLVMHLGQYRWDVLGRIEEALGAVASMLSLLRPGGQMLALIEGDPQEFLVAFLASFPVAVREMPDGRGGRVCRCQLPQKLAPAHLDSVLEREVHSERSHQRYFDLLDSVLGSARLSILDVGGGDGHMAAWWAACGHSIKLLEVSAKEAEKAAARLGKDNVTLHDGISKWPFADDSCDVCLLLFVLHHIPSEAALMRTLTEAARVSRQRVLVLEDQPRAAASDGLRRLAAAVTAEHFRPFGQNPAEYMNYVRADEVWRVLFGKAGFAVESVWAVPGTLQHPVPHTLYDLRMRK